MFNTSKALGVAVGLASSIVVFALLFAGKTTRFDEAALGDGESKFAVVDGARVHCRDLRDAEDCIAGALQRGAQKRYLWLGNSQLHAINQRQEEDRSAPEVLHLKMRAAGGYAVTFSEPNANLQEHLVLFAYLLPRLRPDVLLLPAVFDDFREAGIRAEIAPALRDESTRTLLSALPIGRDLLAELDQSPRDGDDFAGITTTVQERSERALAGWLNEHWALWDARAEARGQIALSLFLLRNTVLGIKPTTARKMIPGRLARNWAALEAIAMLAQEHGIHLYVYINPLRNDIPIPYLQSEYGAFKERLVREFGSRRGITTLDLERTVANDLWGTKASTIVGGEPEYDFMHFRAQGHRALAHALYEALADTRRAGK